MRWQHLKNKYTLAATLRKGDIFKRHRTNNSKQQTYEVLRVLIGSRGLIVEAKPVNSNQSLEIVFSPKTNVH